MFEKVDMTFYRDTLLTTLMVLFPAAEEQALKKLANQAIVLIGEKIEAGDVLSDISIPALMFDEIVETVPMLNTNHDLEEVVALFTTTAESTYTTIVDTIVLDNLKTMRKQDTASSEMGE